MKQIIIWPMKYDVIQTIESEENSVACCLKFESNSYYFSLTIRNKIIIEYPNNYASAIRHNIFVWNWIVILTATKTKYRNELNAAPDMKIHLSSIKPNI